jgi:hypothetical protein
VLVRDGGRRLVAPRLSWPRRLRRKWLGIGLLIGVLFAYELFDVWQLPRATAFLVLGYFGLALLVDLLFKGASFCKFVCPIGQFNFIGSTLAPVEVQVRDAGVCRGCRTSDCIKGRYAAEPLRVVRRGCELGLFLPSKIGSLDCTLCLDCVQACPHDNVALTTRVPGAELLDIRRRSGVGRLTERPDVAALAVVFTFAALLNAFAMTAPAASLERTLAGLLHVSAEAAVLGLLFLGFLVVAPTALLGTAAALTRAAGRTSSSIRSIVFRFALALVPFGLGVWLAHYGFHLLTGWLTIVPVAQSAAIDAAGVAILGQPAWSWAGMRPSAVYPIQLGIVLLGAAGSAAIAIAIANRDHAGRAALVAAPWIGAVVVLAAAAVWVLGQPMDMRGLGLG